MVCRGPMCHGYIAALVSVTRVWIKVGRADAASTARIGRAEDASRTAPEAAQIRAGSASLLAVGFTLGQAGHAHAPARGLLIALAWRASLWPGHRSTRSTRFVTRDCITRRRRAGSISMVTPLTTLILPIWR